MKRTKDQEHDLETASQDDMDVDDEEGGDEDSSEASDDGAGQREDPVPRGNADSNAFFDTFYGLSSTDPRQRSQAAKEMLDHCLVGPSANIKDASYALKRLLNGVCSGRAAARQGNASALAMFLKLSLAQDTLRDIQKNSSSQKELELPTLAYVRHRLLEATEPGAGSGKRKPSEDRDHKFGRLFGILGVVRSGILLPNGAHRPDVAEILETATGFVNDLADLYAYKKWMREPAAHAISTLLSSYYSLSLDGSDAQLVVDHLVQEVIVPRLLMNGDNGTSTSTWEAYSAEQIAIAVHIQTQADIHTGPLMKPLNQPVLAPQRVPSLVASLCETSSVTHPRIHLFWDQFICYITEPVDESKTVQIRRLRQNCPFSDTNPIDLIDSILRHVLIVGLLGVQEGEDSSKTTHEKSALGLCIIRNLSGVEFVSSITGRTRLLLDAATMESVVLQPAIVKHLFLNILSAGSGGRKKQSAHILRPLAHQILESLIDSIENDDDSTARRLAIVRPLLLCDSRFDSKAKTNFIDRLVTLSTDESDVAPGLWNEYLEFLEEQLLKADSAETKETARVSQYEAQGYADLLFHFGRSLLSLQDGSQQKEYRETRVRQLLGFLLASSFFKCEGLEPLAEQSKKRKNKKAAKLSPVIEAAQFVKNHRKDSGLLPYQLRSTLSSRFFSLTAEAIASMMHSTMGTREEEILGLLSFLSNSCSDLEVAGAKKLFSQDEMNEGSRGSDIESPETILKYLQQKASQDTDGAPNKRLHRFKTACAILGSVLYLHLLDCGPHDSWDDDDLDEDAENDASEIEEYLCDLKENLLLFSGSKSDDRDPILAMAEFCTTIMSSPVAAGSQSKGGFPRLLRETMKMVWTSALNLMADSNEETILHSDVLPILLRSIGVDDVGKMDVDGEEESIDETGADADTVGDSDDSVDLPTNAAHDSGFLDEQGRVSDLDQAQASDDDTDEVGINPDRLRSFFEEESDADIDETELEHHEGADAALAKLIQIKQEARKAGQMARERAETSQQLRCLPFLETILNGKPDGWGAILHTDSILPIIYPLLCHRQELENSLIKASGKLDEKRSLLEKITSLLKTKIYKMKFSDRWIDSKSSENIETCSVLAAKILDQMKGKVSKEQRACCSVAMCVAVRAAPDPLERIKVASIYGDIVREWSTKRTTRLESSVFDDFIQHSPVIAQASLCAPLSAALLNARSTYLKTESARLMSLLFNANLNQRHSSLEKKGYELLIKCLEPSFEAFGSALQDPEMKKSKRGKEMLKALGKIFNFALSTRTTISSQVLNNIKKCLKQLQTDTESQQLEVECKKLLSLIDQLCSTPHKHSPPTPDIEENPAGDDDSGEDVDADNVRKAKNKKKGKKKRK